MNSTTIPRSSLTLSQFRDRLGAGLIEPDDAAYDEARLVWNALIDRRPALIARCRSAEEVALCIRFARQHGCRLAVRGGGHNIAGKAVCEGGLVIDLSLMKAVEVDSATCRARVGGGATWADLDAAAQAHGLATPGGVVSTTGVGGLTLGGGLGRLSRAFGLSADNLTAAEVVTAEGVLLNASATEHADLFWAVRGGGGNFGVVTRFEFALHRVGPEVLFGVLVYPLEQAPEVLRHYRDFALAAPRESAIWLDCVTAPPLPFLPEQVHGTPVVMVAPFYAGDLDEGESMLRPLREFGEPLADVVERQPYAATQSALDALFEAGARNYWRSCNYAEMADGVLDVVVDFAARFPSPQSDILIAHVGGAIADISPHATAYPHRNAQFIVSPGARWMDPADDDRCLSWVRECGDALAKFPTAGTYVNFVTEEQGRERAAYGSNYDRLAAVKAKYDPENVFSMNQNVRPQ
ncbi:MAG: FAD-binding oxidoreductase [Ectothiorhodospiraceae bacterium]|jgi:FAD/FMN-containing dehydrogenase